MHNTDNNDDDELSPVDAAEYLDRSPSTLAQWRTFRRGPRYSKGADGRRVLYLRADLDEWLAKQGGPRARFCP
jgi:hypothetical protein